MSFIGEGRCLCNLTLRRFFGVPNCFPGVLITGSHFLLDSGVVDLRDDAYNSNSSRGCQGDHVMACSNRLKWFFLFIFNPHLISWLIGMNPVAQWMGVLSQVSRAIWWKTVPRAWRCWDSSRSASCWWSPLSFSSMGVVSRIRSQRENSLRTSGCIYKGR